MQGMDATRHVHIAQWEGGWQQEWRAAVLRWQWLQQELLVVFNMMLKGLSQLV
jgi:hypothetical protein